MAWFSLTGSNPTQPSNYQLVGSTPPPGCSGTNQICAIQATDNAGQPVLSAALKDEMILALHNRNASTNVQLKT
ncbi:hypothetical protein HCX49_08260 [Sphingobacterium kitahiroshimense]|uniref:hypothetical protein n=1 Tax=Sphingobacterium sp. B16(2022) TaxID=2914044 RepID=UPI00143969B6|nr:hypothetical protein [Sphingobacterium sp. B16(2022)]NJI73196.1 hypothetical protein [Sphingobacterium sp. B16(2022)]